MAPLKVFLKWVCWREVCPNLPLVGIVFWTFLFGFPIKILKTCLLGRGFHTLVKSVSFSSPTDVRSYNSLPFKAKRTRSLLQSMWDPSINPPLGPKSLLAHRLMSTPLRGSTSSMAHCVHSGPNSILQLAWTPIPKIDPQTKLDHSFDLYAPLSLARLSFNMTQCSTTSNVLIRVGLGFLDSFPTLLALGPSRAIFDLVEAF